MEKRRRRGEPKTEQKTKHCEMCMIDSSYFPDDEVSVLMVGEEEMMMMMMMIEMECLFSPRFPHLMSGADVTEQREDTSSDTLPNQVCSQYD